MISQTRLNRTGRVITRKEANGKLAADPQIQEESIQSVSLYIIHWAILKLFMQIIPASL